MSGLRARYFAGLAGQLGKPTGWRGRLVGNGLNRRNRPMVATAVDALGLRPGAAAADLGFGGGIGLDLLHEAVGPTGTVHGVDLSPDMVELATRRFPWARLACGSLTALPLPDGTLDGVLTVNTIYFVDDVATAFAEIARVLAPSGTFALGIGDPDAMAGRPYTPYGFRVRPVDEVIELMSGTGLDVRARRRVSPDEHAAHIVVASRA